MNSANQKIIVKIFEEIEAIGEHGVEKLDEYLGDFVVCAIPRQAEVITLMAYGDTHYDGYSQNQYLVTGVFHNACHTAWDDLNSMVVETASGPSTTIFVKFMVNRIPFGNSWRSLSTKGKLRRSDIGEQKYNMRDNSKS